MGKVSERSKNQLLNDILYVLFVELRMPFRETKYYSVHYLEDWFFVDSVQKNLCYMRVVGDDFHYLKIAKCITLKGILRIYGRRMSSSRTRIG